MRGARRAIAALLLLAASAAAQAEERILKYVSDVQIERDSALAVTETIDVQVENKAINRGIYRDFPTRYRGPNGSHIRVGFRFDGATLDGAPVPAEVAPHGNGVRIKIGDPDRYVPVGEHRYVIRYRTTRQVGRFAGYDELYWNATGNGWMFPIDEAEARIRLPQPARFGQRAAYTGLQGSTESNAEVIEEKPGEIRFATTRALGPYEGLTVAVAFPKGVVAEPSSESRFRDWLADNGPPLVGGLALLGLFAFYLFAWRHVGRDPPAGTVVPIFAPPDELSPAAMRFVTRMGADNRTFAAALVDMGVRGHVRIVEEDGGWFGKDKRRIERRASTAPLPRDEEAALRALCETGESVLMEQKNHAKFSSAKKHLVDVLKDQYEGRLFNKNWGWATAGLLLFLAALWLVAASIVAAMGLSVDMVLVALGAAVTSALLMLWVQTATASGKCLASGLAVLFGALAFMTGAPVLFQALGTGWLLPFVPTLLALPVVISAFFWIDAPTKAGRAVLDRIAGFKHYLSITERERLDRMHPPEDTPELFERYLPYAIALGVENRWANRFAGVLAAAAAQGHQGFGWYSGSSNPWDNPGGFANSVGSSLASTISSASTAPGSS
ncbi:MAG TPA: DUF2207 domain-containing protein, partial [Sphingomicrobium sp.]|nr:DUF2207 domain-containing protein [Sphingomicrobium sp.]